MKQVNLKVYQPMSTSLDNPEFGNRQTSYFYNGLIAETTNFKLISSGDIEVKNDEQFEVDHEVITARHQNKFIKDNSFKIISKENDNEIFLVKNRYREVLLILIENELYYNQ